MGVKVLDEGGSGSFATVMAGMEWTVDKRHDFNIRAASIERRIWPNRMDIERRRKRQ